MADKKKTNELDTLGADLTEAGKIRETITRVTTPKKRGKGRPPRAKKVTSINTAYTNDNYVFLKLLANIRGISMTDQVNNIIEEYRARNTELDKKVKSLQRFLKKGGYLQTKGGVLDRYDIEDDEEPGADPSIDPVIDLTADDTEEGKQ